MPEIKYPVTADTSSFKRGMAEARDAAKQAKGAMEEWTKSQQRASMRMEAMHEEALKMNSAFKSASDETQRTANTLRAFDSALGSPIGKTKGLSEALGLADVGFKNLKVSAVGFNAASAGVVAAGLGIGTAIGSWLNTFPAVRREVDRLRDSFLNMMDSVPPWLRNAVGTINPLAGLAQAFVGGRSGKEAETPAGWDPAKIAAGHQAAQDKQLQNAIRQVDALRKQGMALDDIRKRFSDIANKPGEGLEAYLDGLARADAATRKYAAEAKRHAVEVKKAAEEAARALSMDVFNKGVGGGGMAGMFGLAGGSLRRAEMFGVQAAAPIQEMKIGRNFGPILNQQVAAFGKDAGKVFQSSFSKALEGLPNAILGAIQGGGNVGGAIGASLLGGLGEDLGKKLATKIGGSLGKAFGSLGGPLGSLLGGAVGGLAGKLLGGLFGGGEAAKVDRFRKQLVGAAGGMDSLKKAAQLAGVSLDAVFSAKTVKEYDAAVKELQAGVIAKMEETFARINEIKLEKLQAGVGGLAALFKNAAAQAGLLHRQASLTGRVSGLGREIEELTKAGKTEEVLKKLKEQKRLESELTGIRRGAAAEAEALGERLNRLALLGAGMFQAMREQGMTIVEAMKELSPALDDAARAAELAGVLIGGQFGMLIDFRNKVTENEGLVSAVEGMSSVFEALAATGMLTQETFSALQTEATTLFDEMIAKGFTSDQALALLAPTLFQANEAAKHFGLALDDNTQKMIEQAEQAGLFENMKDPMQELVELQQMMLQLWAAIAQMQGVTLPASLREYIRELERAQEKQQGLGGGGGLVTGPGDGLPERFREPENFQHGSGGMQNFGQGTPATLHGTEGVFTPGDFGTIADMFAARIGNSIVITGGGLRVDLVQSVAEIAAEGVRNNDGGLRTEIERVPRP